MWFYPAPMSRDVTNVIDDGEIRPSMLGNLRRREPLAPVFFGHGADDGGGNGLRAGLTGFLRHFVFGDVVLGGRTLGVFDQKYVLALLGVGLVQVALRAHHLTLERIFGGEDANAEGSGRDGRSEERRV